MLAWTLAWRYASRRAVNVVAVLAVAVALMVQVVATGITDGMLAHFARRVEGLGRHVDITFLPGHLNARGHVTESPDPERPSAYVDLPTPEEFARVEAAVRAVPGVRAVAPLFQRFGVLSSTRKGYSADYVIVNGIDLKKELAASRLVDYVETYRPDPDHPSWFPPSIAERDYPGMYVGTVLAKELGLEIGDLAELYYQNPSRGEGDEAAPVQRQVYRVTQTLLSNFPDVDRKSVYVPMETAIPLYYPRYQSPEDAARVAGFGVWLDTPWEADAATEPVAQAVFRSWPDAQFGEPGTWLARYSAIADAMRHENRLVALVLFLFTLSTGFCVFTILSTLVSRRLRDMGLLRCLGAGRGTVFACFLLVGFLIGAAGAGLGTAAGTALLTESPPADDAAPGDRGRARVDLLYEWATGTPMYPPHMFGTHMIVHIDAVKIAAYALAAVLIAVLAGVYPACWAASREPARVLTDAGG